MTSLPTTEGEVSFSYPTSTNTPLKTWYKTFGDLEISSKLPSIRPLIAIHGGPAMGHNYLLPLSALTTTYSIPLILYDQIGCGNSTHLPDEPSSFWTDAVFVAELFNLVEKLGLKSYDILGSSWGGMIASRFASKKPAGLRRLIISNSFADIKLRYKASDELRRALPAEIQAVFQKHEEAGTTSSPEYQAAFREYNKRHQCTVPEPPELTASINVLLSDLTVVKALSGLEKWRCTGNNKDWTMIGEGKKIEAETLLINGYKEIASDEVVRPFWREIPKVKWVKIMNSTHSPHFEEPERYYEIVGDFLSAE
jgi:L-proline amide hydrolase